MDLLLDTHTALWWLPDDPNLSAHAAALIADRQNTVQASAVSGYAIGLMVRRGQLATPIAQEFAACLAQASIPALALELSHTTAGALLDWDHDDPCDRLIAAQARLEGCVLVSANPAFDRLKGFFRTW